MIIERIERPNRQPIVQESQAKLRRQSFDPNVHGEAANQGRGPERERRPVHGTGIVIAVMLAISIGLPFILHACTRAAS